MNEGTIKDLQMINWLAKDDRQRAQFCYQVKDVFLNAFGRHYGYCVQSFTRNNWDEFEGGVFSYHKHILEQVQVGTVMFHRPTSEFSYSNIRGVEKQSENFSEYYANATDRMDGIKQAPADFSRADGVRALRRLVHAFYPLLRERVPKAARTLYPFITERTWMRMPDGYSIRVPESVAVCSGCGRKLTLSLDRWDATPAKTETGLFGPHPERGLLVRCDTSVYHRFEKYDACHESVKERDHRGWQDPNQPWKQERVAVAHWARLLVPEFLAWKNGTVQEPVVKEPCVGVEV